MSSHKSFIVTIKNSRRWRFILSMAALALMGSPPLTSCTAEPLTVVAERKSSYVIVVPQEAAVSVNEAAVEMQRDIAEATGAKLEIVKDSASIDGPFISLGSTKQAQLAGISAEDIAPEGFRIITKANNLYIIGMDTTTENAKWGEEMKPKITLHPEIPGPAFTPDGGFSCGTANGVYTFLENQLGVRWLFDGDLGRVVPTNSTFTLDTMDRTEVPQFNLRQTLYGRNTVWNYRQKLGYSKRIQFHHNFTQTVEADLFEEHPDWFPMNTDGKRMRPIGSYKVETTNPELVRYYADKAIAAMKADPQIAAYSLSPSDGGGWSQSPESKAFFDPPTPGGVLGPSLTPLILKFYRDVSALVAKEYPQGGTAGYLYTSYSYPPLKGSMELPDNFTPVIVGKSMGYTFYKPETLKLETELLEAWGQVAPKNWYYYGMPTWLRETSAMVVPAAPDQLNALYHSMVKAKITGALIYDMYVSSQGALVNYVNAKMLWNPSGDARAVQQDWLMNAYGPQAGAVMEEFYNKLDESWWADFFRSPDSRAYNVSDLMFEKTFGTYYPEMEKLFLQAEAQPMTPSQQERLDLIKYNMIALQWRLRNAGFLPAEYASPLTRSAQHVFDLFIDSKTHNLFSYVIVKSASNQKVAKAEVRLDSSPVAPTAPTKDRLPNSKFVLFYPTEDGEVRLKPSHVVSGPSFLSYYVRNQHGKDIACGFLTSLTDEDITFQVKANEPYYLYTQNTGVTSTPTIRWMISIPGAALATASGGDDDHIINLHSADKSTLYVYVPKSLALESSSDETGVTVQTLTAANAKLRAAAKGKNRAQDALDTAVKLYQARVVTDLNDRWQFNPDPEKKGEQQGVYKIDFDDRAWKTIHALNYWQDQGFEDFQGTAWYRKTFTLSSDEIDPLAMGDNQLLLFFGAIDGDADIYVNDQKVAEFVFTHYDEGWLKPMAFTITPALLGGKNVIAIKVKKDNFVGGLYRGVSLLCGVPMDNAESPLPEGNAKQ